MHVVEEWLPYLDYKTYVRIVEPDRPARRATPLVLLHGGPGSTHNYFELLDPLADLDGRKIVMYDQIGCGHSWDDSMAGHPDLWQAKTWLGELAALRTQLGLEQLHLLGQSWGGMLAIMYLCGLRPRGVHSLVLSSTLASASLWSEEGHRRLRYLPEGERRTFLQAEATGDFDTPEFRAAEAHYMRLFSTDPVSELGPDAPECLTRPKRSGRESYLAAWGDNELMPSGALAGYEYADRLGELDLPTLIVSGTQDLCSPLVAKQMADALPRARWELFPNCRHLCFAEDTPRYLRLLSRWLSEFD